MSDVIIGGAIVAALFAAMLFLYAVFGTFVGFVIGWVVSITPLGPMVENGFAVFCPAAIGHIVDISAMLGFISGFLGGVVKVTVEKEKEKNE
jgi:hypothetical protein